MHKLASYINNNIESTIAISSFSVIIGSIIYFNYSNKKNENENSNKKKNNKKQIDNNVRKSKRTFLSDNDNSEELDNFNETDLSNKKKKYKKANFHTDVEIVQNNRKKSNFNQKQNKKIDDLYFAMLNNLNKKN
jgi:hypothetical protein